jgi:hypothetical protein
LPTCPRRSTAVGMAPGQVQKINNLSVSIHRTIAEQKYGRYVPGNIFKEPKFIPGTDRQSIEYIDSGGFPAGTINDKGVHPYNASESLRRREA